MNMLVMHNDILNCRRKFELQRRKDLDENRRRENGRNEHEARCPVILEYHRILNPRLVITTRLRECPAPTGRMSKGSQIQGQLILSIFNRMPKQTASLRHLSSQSIRQALLRILVRHPSYPTRAGSLLNLLRFRPTSPSILIFLRAQGRPLGVFQCHLHQGPQIHSIIHLGHLSLRCPAPTSRPMVVAICKWMEIRRICMWITLPASLETIIMSTGSGSPDWANNYNHNWP